MPDQNLTLVRVTGSSRFNPGGTDDENTYFAFIRESGGAILIVPRSDPRWQAPWTGVYGPFADIPAHLRQELSGLDLDFETHQHWVISAGDYVVVEPQVEPEPPTREYVLVEMSAGVLASGVDGGNRQFFAITDFEPGMTLLFAPSSDPRSATLRPPGWNRVRDDALREAGFDPSVMHTWTTTAGEGIEYRVIAHSTDPSPWETVVEEANEVTRLREENERLKAGLQTAEDKFWEEAINRRWCNAAESVIRSINHDAGWTVMRETRTRQREYDVVVERVIAQTYRITADTVEAAEAQARAEASVGPGTIAAIYVREAGR